MTIRRSCQSSFRPGMRKRPLPRRCRASSPRPTQTWRSSSSMTGPMTAPLQTQPISAQASREPGSSPRTTAAWLRLATGALRKRSASGSRRSMPTTCGIRRRSPSRWRQRWRRPSDRASFIAGTRASTMTAESRAPARSGRSRVRPSGSWPTTTRSRTAARC